MGETSGYGYAGFWWRFLAFLIDAFILTIAGTVAGTVLGFGLGAAGYHGETIQATSFVCSMIWWWLYFALFESGPWRATLGKRLCRLVVVDSHRRQVSFGRATGRYFAKILSSLILYFGFLMIGWTRRKQGLHDMIADCIVARKLESRQDDITVDPPTRGAASVTVHPGPGWASG